MANGIIILGEGEAGPNLLEGPSIVLFVIRNAAKFLLPRSVQEMSLRDNGEFISPPRENFHFLATGTWSGPGFATRFNK